MKTRTVGRLVPILAIAVLLAGALVAPSGAASKKLSKKQLKQAYKYTKKQLSKSGTINLLGNPVDWTQLKSVPDGFADGVDNVGEPGAGDIESVTAGTGLTGGGTDGDVTLNVDPSVVQSRLSGTCSFGNVMTGVAQNGDVTCSRATYMATDFGDTIIATSSTTYVAAPGVSATLVLPPGFFGTILATFSGESTCTGGTGSICGLRIMVDGQELNPAVGTDASFDTDRRRDRRLGIPLDATGHDRLLQWCRPHHRAVPCRQRGFDTEHRQLGAQRSGNPGRTLLGSRSERPPGPGGLFNLPSRGRPGGPRCGRPPRSRGAWRPCGRRR